MKNKKHINITIKGKVQDVWYRASTKEQADKIGINGFVQNLPDGSVYAEMEGTEDQVAQMVEWCKEGPPLAKVDSVTVTEENWEGFADFSIKQ